MLTLKIRDRGAAFHEGGDPTAPRDPGPELARLLRRAADQVEAGYDEHSLLDVNGNTVGSWRLTGR